MCTRGSANWTGAFPPSTDDAGREDKPTGKKKKKHNEEVGLAPFPSRPALCFPAQPTNSSILTRERIGTEEKGEWGGNHTHLYGLSVWKKGEKGGGLTHWSNWSPRFA